MTRNYGLLSLGLAGTLLVAGAPARGQRLAGLPAVAQATENLPGFHRATLDSITGAQLREYLSFIASDELEGRDTPSRGLDTAARYIAAHLEHWGLKPAGDNGTFFQKIALRRSKLDPAASSATIGTRSFKYGTDFKRFRSGFSRASSYGTARGPAVYVGNGWLVKSKNLDPYAGIDVKGKVMVVQTLPGFRPAGVTQAELQGARGTDWDDPSSYAQRHGAVGIIWVPTFQNLATWDTPPPQRGGGGGEEQPRPEAFLDQDMPIPGIVASASMLQALFFMEKVSADEIFSRGTKGEPGESFELSPKTVEFTLAETREMLSTQNVVGILEGSDPQLKNEYVAFGAHYDHDGIRVNAPGGDKIMNGADDDGSGTCALIALANAFAHGPRPKRSLLFVWHCGEEKGLWGSQYFTDHPTVPINQIVTQLNIDMIGRSKKEGDTNPRNANLSGPNQVYVIGSRMMSTQLGDVSEAVNKAYLNLAFDYRYDDPKDPNRFFYRSDHFNYARKGIPIIFYFDGVHQDYHQPSDEVDKIDFEKYEKITRTVAATAMVLANSPTRPAVDKPLPEQLRGR